MDYADMEKTASKFRDVAQTLSDARVDFVPVGASVYGYDYLATAVEKVKDAFNQRHDAIVKNTDGIALTMDACRLAYKAADAVAEADLTGLLSRLLKDVTS